MSTLRHGKIQVVNTTQRSIGGNGGLATSDTATMQAMFPGTPYIDPNGIYDDAEVAKATMSIMNDRIAAPKSGFGTWSPNYDLVDGDTRGNANGSPDITTVATGPGGLPGTPWTPNRASPGSTNPGDTNPASLPDPVLPAPVTSAVGGGSSKNPTDTAQNISALFPGQLVLGSGAPQGVSN